MEFWGINFDSPLVIVIVIVVVIAILGALRKIFKSKNTGNFNFDCNSMFINNGAKKLYKQYNNLRSRSKKVVNNLVNKELNGVPLNAQTSLKCTKRSMYGPMANYLAKTPNVSYYKYIKDAMNSPRNVNVNKKCVIKNRVNAHSPAGQLYTKITGRTPEFCP